MRVDVEKKNPALESLFTDPEQTIFLDANFFIPPDRSRMGTKPIPFLKFCEIWLDPIFDAFPNLAIHESVYHELVADAVKKYADERQSESPSHLRVYKDAELNEAEQALMQAYMARSPKGNLKVSELAKLLADKLYVFALTITEEDARKRFIDRVRKLQLRKNRETMLKDAMSVYPISMQAFDRNKYLFNCKNGTLDMRTLEFREHRPEDYLTMESGITYDPEADCPRWHSFIQEVMCGDKDLADFLQRSLGYALTGDTSQECMFILYGATSRNGKGTAMETFLKIMGDYGKTSNPDMLATKFRGGNTGGPSEEVARLVGARFVNISEPEKKITFNAALVKRMTGNDTINARFLNENSFDFVPVFKIFINTNYLPNVNDMTLFQSGRLKIIPFNRHFEEGEQDQGLKGQFAKTENLSGIFNWCLEGYKKFCQQGLESPAAVKTATEDYKDDSDRIGQFIEAWIEKDETSELRSSAAYQLYTKWCEENGYSSENQKNFKNAIGVHFRIARKRPKGGGGMTTIIVGCKFREVEAGAEDATVQEAYKPKDALI